MKNHDHKKDGKRGKLYKYLCGLKSAVLNELGQEMNNPVPVAQPSDLHPISLADQIKRLVRNELSEHAQDNDHETYEESQDFDCGDDDKDLDTQYTILDDEPLIAEKPSAAPEPEPENPAAKTDNPTEEEKTEDPVDEKGE